MITVGPDELGVMLVILFVTIAIPAWITLFAKKKLSGKLPAGLALSFFFPLIGHLYLACISALKSFPSHLIRIVNGRVMGTLCNHQLNEKIVINRFWSRFRVPNR